MRPLPERAHQDLPLPAFKVAEWLYRYLDLDEWRPMKLEVIMLSCRVEKMTASRALRTLVRKGYLARRGGGPKPYEYRLLPPPMPSVKPRAA